MLTLVVPTRNRSFYIKKLLKYYAASKLIYPIFIGDSSDSDAFKENEACIKEYNKQIEIKHFFFPHEASLGPGEGTIVCMNHLLENVKTPYAVFNADDDFFVPFTLHDCVDFLEANPDYSAVSGKALLVAIDASHSQKEEIRGVGPYPQIATGADLASDRLYDNILRKNGTLQFAVKRTGQMRSDWQCVQKFKLDNFFEELLTVSLCSIAGKFKTLNRLYMVRRAHAHMTSGNSRDVFDWMCGPRFSRQCEAFLECVSCRLMETEAIGVSDARKLVKKIFWRYLNQALSHKLEMPDNEKKISEYLKSLIKSKPSLYKSLRKIRSSFFKDSVSLCTFLNSQFVYKTDFMPIYKIIGERQ